MSDYNDELKNECLIDGEVTTYDACGEAVDEIKLDALKIYYSKAFPIYLGYGTVYTVGGVRQYRSEMLHFFRAATDPPANPDNVSESTDSEAVRTGQQSYSELLEWRGRCPKCAGCVQEDCTCDEPKCDCSGETR